MFTKVQQENWVSLSQRVINQFKKLEEENYESGRNTSMYTFCTVQVAGIQACTVGYNDFNNLVMQTL